MLAFGGAMVLLMIWRPRGLIAHREPSLFLATRTKVSSDFVKEGR